MYGSLLLYKGGHISDLSVGYRFYYFSGEPEIRCGTGDLTVSFLTQQAFTGRVYVKGFADDVHCAVRGSLINNNAATRITLPFEICGVHRGRQVSLSGMAALILYGRTQRSCV